MRRRCWSRASVSRGPGRRPGPRAFPLPSAWIASWRRADRRPGARKVDRDVRAEPATDLAARWTHRPSPVGPASLGSTSLRSPTWQGLAPGAVGAATAVRRTAVPRRAATGPTAGPPTPPLADHPGRRARGAAGVRSLRHRVGLLHRALRDRPSEREGQGGGERDRRWRRGPGVGGRRRSRVRGRRARARDPLRGAREARADRRRRRRLDLHGRMACTPTRRRTSRRCWTAPTTGPSSSGTSGSSRAPTAWPISAPRRWRGTSSRRRSRSPRARRRRTRVVSRR